MARHAFLIALIVLSGMLDTSFGQYDDNSVSRCFKKVKEIFPNNWEVIQIDHNPSVSVENWNGYRFLLRAGRREYLQISQQQTPSVADPNAKYVWKYSHIDLILFPIDAQVNDDFIQKIAWLELEQEYYTKPVYMGSGDRFHWFANTTLFWQEQIRKKLDLFDGENQVELLMAGLLVDDSGSCTRNSVVPLLADHGDVVIPNLQKMIEESDFDKSHTAFGVLGCIRTDKATQLLRKYYNSPQTRELAAYALVHQPYRPETKDEYIDMLKRRIRIFSALEACVEFNLTEALPNIESICSKPEKWRLFYEAYLAKRTLQGNPVSQRITEAYSVVKGPSEPDEVKQAKAVMLAASDREAVAVMALNLIFLHGKITDERLEFFGTTGFEILAALPEETTKPLIELLLDSLDEESPSTAHWLSPIDRLRQFYKVHYSLTTHPQPTPSPPPVH